MWSSSELVARIGVYVSRIGVYYLRGLQEWCDGGQPPIKQRLDGVRVAVEIVGFQPMRFRNASILEIGARETAAKATSREAFCWDIHAHHHQRRHHHHHSPPRT
jgi:hypothetical protein